MKASKTVTTIFAAATLVGAISLAYAQASTDGSQTPVTQTQDASGTPAGTLAAPAESTGTTAAPTPAQAPTQVPVQGQTYDNASLANGNVPDNSAPLITERSPRADRN